MKVLIVDDAAANRLILGSLVRRLGHEVLSAGSAEAALQTVRVERPSVILTDRHMPHADEGLAFAREVRRMIDGKPPRIALMTGDASSFADSENLFDMVLEKPVLAVDLQNFIQGV